MSEPRKHHYLPQFYLRGFSANRRSIFQIEKQGGRAYLSSIRDTAAIRDYHELDTEEAKDPTVIEKRLAQVEAQLAEALARAIQCGVTTPETHNLLIQLRPKSSARPSGAPSSLHLWKLDRGLLR